MNAWVLIACMAAVTFLPRVLPGYLVGKIHYGKRIEKFLRLIPYTAMTALVLPGIFSVDTSYWWIGAVGGLVAIGLSCVKLEEIIYDSRGTVLRVSGADLMDGTPIYDIKPYLPLSDCRPNATAGFAEETAEDHLEVVFPDDLAALVPKEHLQGLIAALKGDPRPAYQNDPDREYGFYFLDFDIRFKVRDHVLTVTEIVFQ